MEFYCNRTPYLELHSPTKNLLTDAPHKFDFILQVFFEFLNVFILSSYLQMKFDN